MTQHKAFSTDVKLSADDTRTVVATINTAAVDRDGEVVVPMGCNAKDFEANPVVPLMHSYYGLPVARCVALQKTQDAVVAKIRFADRPEGHPADAEWVPDTLYSLYKQGVMNAFSVGFLPTETRPASDRDVEKYGPGCRRVIGKWKLLEVSCVPIPCNPEAVAQAVSKGYVTQATADKLFAAAPAGAGAKSADADEPESDEKGDGDGGEECPECGAVHAEGEACPEKAADDGGEDEDGKTVTIEVPPPPPAPAEPKSYAFFVDLSPPPPAPADPAAVVKSELAAAVAKAKGCVYVV